MSIYREVWLCLMTSGGNEENLRELIEPCLEYINGVQAVFHLPTDSGADYLESVKGEGKVLYSKFSQRHWHSMNRFLYEGTMEQGETMLLVDSLERLTPAFFQEKLVPIHSLMDEADISCVSNFGKPLVVRYEESIQFHGSPHWYMSGLSGRSINIELPDRYFKNVRPLKRTDPRHWVRHYVRYYLYPAGSNSCLLGLEKNGDPQKLFPIAEARRLAFREELRRRDVPLTVEGVEGLLRDGLDDTMKPFFREAKELNDLYRDVVLGDKSFPDDHDWKNMVAIP